MSSGMAVEKKLSFSDVMGMCIGQIIGSGVMVLTGIVVGLTGHGTPWAFILGACIAISATIPFAIMASAIPASGAGYTYMKKMIGDKAAFMYLLSFVITQMLIATFAKGFASYFVAIFPQFNENVVALGVLAICLGINMIGLKTAAVVQKIMVAFLLLSLAVFIGFGLPKVEWSYLAVTTSNIMPNGFKSFLMGSALLSFAAGGAKYVAENAGKIENPGKVLPRAMVGSTLLVACFYALIGIVAAGVLPLEQVAFKNLTVVAKEIFSPAVYLFFVFGGAMFALLTTLNGTLSWVTRGLQASAKEGWLPEYFAKENKGGAPVLLLLIFGLVGGLPIMLGMDTTMIATMGVGLDMICEFSILFCAFFLPSKYPKEYEAASFRFKTVKRHYIFLTFACTIMLGTAYVNLSELNLKAYLTIIAYGIFSLVLTKIRYKYFLEKQNKVK